MLTHYVIIRRDLPVGVMCAQIVHAAGESFAAYVAHLSGGGERRLAPVALTSNEERVARNHPTGPCRDSSEKERRIYSEVAGSSPALGPIHTDFSRTKSVVLGARNVSRLTNLSRALTVADIAHTSICEPDAPYHGALMAIGLWPIADTTLARDVLRDYHLLRSGSKTFDELICE